MESRLGRPRSDRARTAVLNAVDDLVTEVGYAGVTIASIAQRAGVSRQTIYRWWSTKAEILLEATLVDAREELAVRPTGDASSDLTRYVESLIAFLAHSPAGTAYRALLGAAQHDPEVARLLRDEDVLGASATAVLGRCLPDGEWTTESTAQLIGPPFFWILSGRDPSALRPAVLVDTFLQATQPSSMEALPPSGAEGTPPSFPAESHDRG